jgi:UPF0716 protein FxsA
MPIVFVLFIIIPIIEITILINVGQLIGAWYTIALVLLSAFVGVNMLRYQGLATLGRAQKKMSQGEMPQQEMIEGLVLAVGGALLITPGFVTDVIGFCCLVPLTRIGFIKLVSHRFKQSMSAKMSGSANFGSMNGGSFHSETRADSGAKSGDVFEGEYSKEAEVKYTLREDSLDKQDNRNDKKD